MIIYILAGMWIYLVIRCIALLSFMMPLENARNPRVPKTSKEVTTLLKQAFFYQPFEWDFNKFLKEKK